MSHEDSLLKKKQAQWNRERAEEQTPWFPFGRPGCGSPNKKSERRESTSVDTASKKQVHQETEVHAAVEHAVEQTDSSEPRPQPAVNQLIPPNFCYVNPLLPYQAPMGMAPQFQSCPPMYMYNFLPQGPVPMPLHMIGEINKEAACPVTMLQNLQHYSVPALSTSFYGSEPPTQDVRTFQETSVRQDDISMITSQYSTSREVQREHTIRHDTAEDKLQRFENEQKEKLMKEEEERRLTEEREEELRKSLDRRHEAVLKALEKAQKDAEVLRKAKLYKHVIDGSERKDELEQKLLGVDSQTGEEVFKQISQWEKQKKLDWESLKERKSLLSKKKESLDLNDNHLPSKIQTRSRSSSFGNDHVPDCTFAVYKEDSGEKENMVREEKSQEAASAYSHEDTFRRSKSLRLPSRMTSSLHSPSVSHTITNPLFTPISTRSRRMRTMHDGPLVTSNCDNVMSVSKTENLKSPIPKILVDDEVKSAPLNAAGELFTRMRSRSAFSSPTSSTPNSPLSSTVYSKKLAEKGCTHHGEDRLSPDIRRRDEANLSRQSSMTSLKGSLCNLRGSVQNLSSPTESPNLNKYRSMNPAYRSFNLKKSSDRQKETLERLTKLREQLRLKENFYESRNGSNLSMIHP